MECIQENQWSTMNSVQENIIESKRKIIQPEMITKKCKKDFKETFREAFLPYLYANITWQAITLVFKLNRLVVIENDIGCLATGQLY